MAACVLLAVWGGGAAARAQSQAEVAAAKLPKFEVASVRLMEDRDKLPMAQQMYYMSPPGAAQFTVRNATLTNLIAWAFGIDDNQLSGEPGWTDSTYYEIAARPEGDAGLSYEQLKPYLQQLLRERFHLAYHRETKDMKGYALVVAKGGAKLVATKGSAAHAYLMSGRFDAQNEPVGLLAGMLSHALGQPVADMTGLKGNYDFTLKYAPLEDADSSLPSIFTAVEEQLGLKLDKAMVPVEMFVIDHADRVPTEN